MAKDYTDISAMLNKTDNAEMAERVQEMGIPKENTLSSTDFVNMIVKPIQELQQGVNDIESSSVKGISQNNRTYLPDEKGIITLPSAESVVSIFTSLDESRPLVIVDGKAIVPLQVVSTSNGAATYEVVSIDVYTAPIGSTSFVKTGSFTMSSVNSGSSRFEDIDITAFLASGTQQVRLVGTGSTTGVTGFILFSAVTLSTLALSFATDTSIAQRDTIKLSYYIYGAINKLLYISVDGIVVVNGKNIGTSVYNQTPYTEGLEISDTRFLSHGVHKISARLVSADDTTKATDWIVNEVFLLADESDHTPYLVVNDVVEKAMPYVDTELFKYSLFASGMEAVPFIVRAVSADETETYINQDLGLVPTEEGRTYTNSLNVDSTADSIPVYLYFYTKDGDREVKLRDEYFFIELDNRNNFAPTPMQSNGFILNPKVRSNSEENPLTIINALNGNMIDSEWEGIDTKTGGYIDGVLRVKSGGKVTIKKSGYDVFSGLRSSGSTESLTIEMDVMITNLRDYDVENEPVLTIGSKLSSDGKVLGFEMLPLRAHLLTLNNRTVTIQDIQYGEDKRTHIAVNIVHNIANLGRNYVRIFINGVCNREFQYLGTDIFSNGDEDGIVIGSSSADIDIYGMRIYKQALGARQIEQDMKAALPTADEKSAFHKKNDILGDDNTINLDKCQHIGLNTLLIQVEDTSKNSIPNYSNSGNNVSKVTQILMVYNPDGSVNWKYCQKITHCKQKGQGTSSMTYWLWNITLTPTETSERYVMNAALEWVLDESVSGVDCYLIFPNGLSTRSDIKGLKNVAKANWASSMQSHKMGWCNLYTDLYWRVVGDTSINKVSGYENCRMSVTQLPFLMFVEDANGIRFSNVMTYGPGKFDKLCWGTKAVSPNYIKSGKNASIFTALEGSANGRPLPERKVPWLRDEVFYYLNRSNDKDSKNETLIYNGEENLDVDKAIMNVYDEGLDTEYEIPKGFTKVPGSDVLWEETEDTDFDTQDPYKVVGGNTIKFFRRAYNHDYSHNHNLRYVLGTVETLKGRTDLDTNFQYWVTQSGGGADAYDLFRWNPITSTWVNAGTEKSESTIDGYSKLNLFTQCSPWFTAYSISYKTSDPNNMNEAFIKARVQHYYNTSTLYYNEVNMDYSQCFRKFAALKDNWCKNTYEVLHPDGLIHDHSDDNDTSGDLDNVGASKCPYFVEEHDRCDADGNFDPDGANTYWNSDTNVRYCLREKARDGEMSNMMQSMMNAMADMAGSVEQCLDRYFFSTQRYFPQVVYNEQGRLLYEDAAVAMSEGRYTNAIDPLSQNLGDHLQSEMEFWKKRVAYLASWCRAASFCPRDGSNTFSFRSGKNNATYRFTIKAHQAIYPAVMVDGSVRSITKHRCMPNETYTLDAFTVGTQDITCFLCGVDYYMSIGDLSGMAINSQVLQVTGKRLTEFKADGSDGNFAPHAISFAAPRLKDVAVRNVATIAGAPDLSGCLNLSSMDFTGCDGITAVTMPSTSSLEVIKLPRNLNAIEVVGLEGVTVFIVEGVDSVRIIRIEQSADVVAHEIYSILGQNS